MENIKTIEGKTKVLLSAPHVYNHRRPNLLNKYKIEEKYTDELVKEITKESDCFGIYTTGALDYDPNYHKVKDNEYKKEIERIVKKNKIKQFIDIHGLNDDKHSVDVMIYYKSRFTKSIRLAQKLSKYIDSKNLNGINIQILRLPEDGSETLTDFVASQLRIPSIQIEIARYIRNDKELREFLINNFVEYLKN